MHILANLFAYFKNLYYTYLFRINIFENKTTKFIFIRYVNGSCSNSEILIVNQAGYQVKKILDIGNKLGADCFLFTAECEGQKNSLNSELSRDMKHYAQFLRLIVDYKERMGYRKQLLIDSTDKKNDYKLNHLKDPLRMLCFLKHFNLDKHYKINFSPEQNYSLLAR